MRLLHPGSAGWLVYWDLRLALRVFESSRRGALRLPGWLSIALRSSVLVLAHLLPVAMLWMGARSGPDSPKDVLQMQHMLAMMAQVLPVSMTMAALFSVVNQLSARQALDLQLSSPVPYAQLNRSRLYLTGLSTLIGLPVFVLPFANVGPFFGHWQLLWLYPTLIGEMLIASALGLSIAGGLVRTFGAARIKRYISWISIVLFGSSGFLLQMLSPSGQLGGSGALSAYSAFWLGSVNGAWLPSLSLLIVGLGAAAVSSHLVGKHFLEAANAPEIRRAKPVALRFSGSLPIVVLRQQWRLISRNPMLGSNLLSPLLAALFPYIFGHGPNPGGHKDGVEMLVWMTGLAAPMTAFGLCWAATSLDEAPGLAYGAPRNRGTIWRWQMLAGLLPTWLATLPAIVVLGSHSLTKAALLGLVSLVSSVCGSIIAGSRYRPVSRTEAKVNHGYRQGEVILLMAYSGLWAGVASAINGFGYGLLFLPFALGIPAWALMRTEEREYLYE